MQKEYFIVEEESVDRLIDKVNKKIKKDCNALAESAIILMIFLLCNQWLSVSK